jgi:hypothetical protein
VIVNHNGGEDLVECLKALGRQVSVALELVVVDNCSTDGFAGGANRGAKHATGATLVFMNPDVTLAEGAASVLHSDAGGSCGVGPLTGSVTMGGSKEVGLVALTEGVICSASVTYAQ